MGFRTLMVWEFLWYYCSELCGSSSWWIWDLILLWLHSFHLAEASLSLDMGYLFWWIPVSSYRWFSTSSCNFGTLAGGDESMSIYSTILNWKPIPSFLTNRHHILHSWLYQFTFLPTMQEGSLFSTPSPALFFFFVNFLMMVIMTGLRWHLIARKQWES